MDTTATVTIDVEKAVLTVTADDQEKTYGEDNFELTVSYSGFVNNEDESVIDVLPTVTTTAAAATVARLFDINGRLVVEKSCPNGEIDCSVLKRGTYLLKVTLQDGKYFTGLVMKK